MEVEQKEYSVNHDGLAEIAQALEGTEGEFRGRLRVNLYKQLKDQIPFDIFQIARMKMEWPDIISFRGRIFMQDVIGTGVINLKDGKAVVFEFKPKFRDGWMSR